MAKKIYIAEYSGHPVRYMFRNELTYTYFKDYIDYSEDTDFDICADEERIQKIKTLLPPFSSDSYIEYRALMSITARELLKYQCCLFHSVSFLYREKAWLLTAPSGTGKTTQYLNWKRMYPDEITMICGDLPVLEMRDNGIIYVSYTSWNGKENFGNKLTAPLGGIIYLRQGKNNYLTEISCHDGLIDILSQFQTRPDTEEEIIIFAKIVDCIFRKYPVYSFTNIGDDESTILLRKCIDDLITGEKNDI